jgi:hypothetical protein
MVFATQLIKFYLDKTASAHLDGKAKTIYAATLTVTNQTAEPLGCNKNFSVHLPACPDRFAALTGQFNNPGLIRNARQRRLIWTGRKQANT